MHIKQIEITNFKSFKDKTILSFHKNSNVIVGKNGSGKSNLITALEFIICCPKIEPNERKNFIHEGEGDCKIEIIFDNSLQRIKESRELVLTRILSTSLDNFYLNSKLISREEVKGLFESGGIPITSPYFMVLQGKINSLINLSNEQRFNLIKSIAGVSKYEEDREKSLKMLEETKQTQSKVEGILERILGKLEGLEEDKEKLEENEKLEKEKRRYEIGYKQREIIEISERVYKCGGGGNRGEGGGKDKGEEGRGEEEGGKGNDYEEENINEDYEDYDEFHIEFELQEIRKKINNLKINNPPTTPLTTPPSTHLLESKLSLLSNQLKDLNLKKLKIKEIYEKNLIELEGLKKLKKEINEKGNEENKGKGNIYIKSGNIKNINLEIEKLSKNLLSKNLKKDNKDKNEIYDLNSLKFLVEKRNEFWREEKNLKNEIKGIEEELKGIGIKINIMGVGNIKDMGVGNNGLNMGVGNNLNLNPTHTYPLNPTHTLNNTLTPNLKNGILVLDLFDIPEDLIPAFESVAGPHLFSVVIENESLIPSLPYKDCTFIPLNRMFYKEAPLLENEELFLLSKKIQVNNYEYEYDQSGNQNDQSGNNGSNNNDQNININNNDQNINNNNNNNIIINLNSLLRFITKNSFVSSDIKSSNFFSKKFKINVVTLDGDFFSKNGVITGGFNEKKKILIEYKRNKKKKNEIEKRLKEIKKEIEKIDLKIEYYEVGGSKDNDGTGKEGNDYDGTCKDNGNINEDNINENINLNIKISYLKNKILYLKNPNFIKFNEIQNLELKTLAIKGEDDNLLENFNFIKERIKKYNKKYIENLNSGGYHDGYNQNLNIDGNNKNLNPHNNLNPHINNPYHNNINPHINNELARLKSKEKSLLDFLKKKKILKIEKFEDLEMEKERAKRHVLYGKRLGLMKEIGLENYKEMDLIYPELSKGDLILKLKEIKSKLKKFDFINKRALTQWNSHLEQKETLKTRLKELKETLKKIKEFIKDLDGKKEKFLEFTFEMVRHNFKKFSKKMIFEMDMEIVKREEGGIKVGGSSKRILSKDKGLLKDKDNLPNDNLNNNLLEDDLPNYELPFDNTTLPSSQIIIAHNNLPLDLNLLSGGQKTMIALCLIFSIQKIDPSPFYIFDEADANLDKQSREKITELFKETVLEEDVQFIITTFKEELVECGNKFIGVSFKEKKSYLGEVSKEIVSEFMRE